MKSLALYTNSDWEKYPRRLWAKKEIPVHIGGDKDGITRSRDSYH